MIKVVLAVMIVLVMIKIMTEIPYFLNALKEIQTTNQVVMGFSGDHQV